jgi:quinol monooxygenase YgiN
MTLIIVATVTARPECRDELESLLVAQIPPTRAEPGCINYDLHVDLSDPCAFVFHESWTCTDALSEHMAMPHLAPFLSQLDRLLAKPIEVRQLRMVNDTAAP